MGGERGRESAQAAQAWMRLGRGLQRLCLRLWWGSLGYRIPFSRRGRARGGGCAGRGADAAALCPADKEELHNRRLRDTRVCARDRGRWVGRGVGGGRGGPREGPILCQLGKPRPQRSWGPGQGAASRLQIGRKPLPHRTQALVFPPFLPPPGGRSLSRLRGGGRD